jgi:diguanylate cyclase
VNDEQNWKNKYLANLEQLEASEQRLQRAEQLLRRSIARLSLAAAGVDPALDQQLDRLRGLAKTANSEPHIEAMLDTIADTVKQIERERETGAREPMLPPEVLARLLDKMAVPASISAELKHLRSRLTSTPTSRSVEDLVTQTATLLSRAVTEQRDETPPAAARETGDEMFFSGVRRAFKELLARLTRLNTSENGMGLERRISGLGALDEIDRIAAELVDLLEPEEHRTGSATPGLRARPESDTDATAARRLAGLLEKLSVPSELLPELETLRLRLEQPMDEGAWGDLLSGIADIVTRIRAQAEREKSELQQFLVSLQARLVSLDENMHGTEVQRLASFEHGLELDETMRENMAHIRSSMAGASSMDELKDDIQNRLDTINAQLRSHRSAEDQRHVDMARQLETLRRRVQEMERETGELQGKLKEKQELALRDSLTQIPNRLAFDQRYDQEVARWRRYSHPLSLIVCDIDHFKRLNDTYGHKAGDKALALIARGLAVSIRETDFLARYGGEEFVVLLPETTLETATVVAEKLRAAIEAASFHYEGKRVPITLSVGYATFATDEAPETVFKRADQALYRAKSDGRNRCVAG